MRCSTSEEKEPLSRARLNGEELERGKEFKDFGLTLPVGGEMGGEVSNRLSEVGRKGMVECEECGGGGAV